MGSGVSVPEDLSETNVNRLREEYDKLKNEGLPDKEIQEKLAVLKEELTSNTITPSLSSKIKNLPIASAADNSKPLLDKQSTSKKESSVRIKKEASTRINGSDESKKETSVRVKRDLSTRISSNSDDNTKETSVRIKKELSTKISINDEKEASVKIRKESSTKINNNNNEDSNNKPLLPKLGLSQPKTVTSAQSTKFNFNDVVEVGLGTIQEEGSQKGTRKSIAIIPPSPSAKLVRKRSFNSKNSTRTPSETPRSPRFQEVKLSSPRNDTTKSPKNETSDLNTISSESTDSTEIKLKNPLLPVIAQSKIDNWDSVTELPFCNVCKMSFKSLTFMDRHVKFSEVHQRNVEQMEQAAKAKSTEKISVNSLPTSKNTDLVLKKLQEEGIDYRLVYSGSKFFWRTQDNVDFNVYHHVNCDTVEVISFDTVKDKELNRLYFQFSNIANLIEEEVNRNIDFKLKELAVDKNIAVPTREVLYPQIQRNCLATYLLNRLQVHEGKIIFLTSIGLSSTFSTTTDKTLVSPLLTQPPSDLIAVNVERRSKSIAHQFTGLVPEALQQFSKSKLENIEEVPKEGQ